MIKPWILALIAAAAIASHAQSAELAANCSTASSVIMKAAPGDVVKVSPGSCGPLLLGAKVAQPSIRVIAADPTSPPTFTSMRTVGFVGLQIEGLKFTFVPGTTTYGHQNVTAFEGKSSVTLRGVQISSGPAVNGITDTVASTPYGTVMGWPLGRGVWVADSDLTIEGSEIFGVERGVVVSHGGAVSVLGSYIHDIRRTMVMGDAVTFDVIGNRLEKATPWKWGQTPIGDHANYISIQQAQALPARSRSARVIGNVTGNAGTGIEVLGFVISRVDQIEVRDNVISGSDHQGIVVNDIGAGVIENNALLGRAQVLLSATPPTSNVILKGNLSRGYEDRAKGASGNVIGPDNQLLQYLDPAKPGYLSPEALAALISQTSKLNGAAGVQAARSAVFPVDLGPQVAELQKLLSASSAEAAALKVELAKAKATAAEQLGLLLAAQAANDNLSAKIAAAQAALR